MWAKYQPGVIQAIYSLPQASTLSSQAIFDITLAFAAEGAVRSRADHLGFLFGYGSVGLLGFPDPFDRHDPLKVNDPKVNGRHIRNALKGIQRNLGKTNLHTFLEKQVAEGKLTSQQFNGLTEALDNLALNLKNQWHLYDKFGPELSQEILKLLTEMGYTIP